MTTTLYYTRDELIGSASRSGLQLPLPKGTMAIADNRVWIVVESTSKGAHFRLAKYGMGVH